MDALIHTIFDTDWGFVIVGIFLLGACLIEFFSNKKPKI